MTEELHAKQQEAARKEAERAARKAPQDAAADAKGAGEPASKKGSAARSSRPPGRPDRRPSVPGSSRGDLVTELDGTPVRDAADLQLRLPLLRIGEVAEFAVSRDGGFRSSAWVFRSSASRSRPSLVDPGINHGFEPDYGSGPGGDRHQKARRAAARGPG